MSPHERTHQLRTSPTELTAWYQGTHESMKEGTQVLKSWSPSNSSIYWTEYFDASSWYGHDSIIRQDLRFGYVFCIDQAKLITYALL